MKLIEVNVKMTFDLFASGIGDLVDPVSADANVGVNQACCVSASHPFLLGSGRIDLVTKESCKNDCWKKHFRIVLLSWRELLRNW